MEKIGEGIIAITFRKVTFPTAILWTFESAITLRDSPSKVSKAGWLDWLQSGRFLLDAMSSCAFDAWARQKPETCIIMHHHASSCIHILAATDFPLFLFPSICNHFWHLLAMHLIDLCECSQVQSSREATVALFKQGCLNSNPYKGSKPQVCRCLPDLNRHIHKSCAEHAWGRRSGSNIQDQKRKDAWYSHRSCEISTWSNGVGAWRVWSSVGVASRRLFWLLPDRCFGAPPQGNAGGGGCNIHQAIRCICRRWMWWGRSQWRGWKRQRLTTGCWRT